MYHRCQMPFDCMFFGGRFRLCRFSPLSLTRRALILSETLKGKYMPKTTTTEQKLLREELWKFCSAYTTQADAADKLDISDAYLSDMLAKRRAVGPKVQRKLGYQLMKVAEHVG